MTELDTEIVPAVLEIIEEVGVDAVFHVPYGREYDATTGETSEPTEKTFDETVSPPDEYKDSEVNGDTIKTGNCRVYLAASGLEFTPKKGMVVDVDGHRWTIQPIKILKSGDSVAAYELALSR